MDAVRACVEAAAKLAVMGERDKDGAMVAMAAKLMSGIGPVAIPGKAGPDGKPQFFDAAKLAETAAALGADMAKGGAASAAPLTAQNYCAIGYWRETCDYNGYCRWEYVC